MQSVEETSLQEREYTEYTREFFNRLCFFRLLNPNGVSQHHLDIMHSEIPFE